MELRFSPLFSGSSGNSVYVKGGDTELLIDAGVSCSRLTAELSAVGADARDIQAILITHEHSDHIKGVGIFARKYGTPVYATAPTWQAMEDKLGDLSPELRRVIEPEQDFFIGNLNIQPFSTPHDAADSVGYVISTGDGAQFALATDIGCVRTNWLNAVTGCAAVLLESNYDPGMLQAGRYPYELKRRIQSRRGHLSNDDAAEVALSLLKSGTRQLVLGHLSKENNFPELALQCCTSVLERDGLTGESVCVARRDGNSGIFTVAAGFD